MIMKKLLFIVLSILALSLFTVPTYADSPADISVTLTPSTTGSVYICGGTSDNSCDGYSYLIVNINSSSSRSYDSTITSNFYDSTLGAIVNGRIGASPLSDSLILSVNGNNFDSLYFTKPAWLSDGSVTLTLSASQGCPSCPTPEPCPDPDEPFIVGLFREGFWGVATAIVALIVPIVALFLVFRLIHDFFWGRG